MLQIGFICDIRDTEPPIHRYAIAWTYRIFPMSNWLLENNCSLFIFSPHGVDLNTGIARGFIVNNNAFCPTSLPIPLVNAGYFFDVYRPPVGCRHTYSEFQEWIRKNNIEVFPNQNVSRLAGDKLASFEYINSNISCLQPACNLYTDKQQLGNYLTSSDTVFLKPRYGGHGDGIFVVKPISKQLFVHYYAKWAKWSTSCDSPATAANSISYFSKDRPYIIQVGINTTRYNDAAFDLRIIVISTQSHLYATPRLRVGTANSDVSNTGQGGSLQDPNIILSSVFPQRSPYDIVEKASNIAVAVSKQINRDYSDSAYEIAYDFILDTEGNLYLAEMNVQPGMNFPGHKSINKVDLVNFEDIFSMTPEELIAYDKYTRPHGEHLARFLLEKLNRKIDAG